jgi:hypothetical protein
MNALVKSVRIDTTAQIPGQVVVHDIAGDADTATRLVDGTTIPIAVLRPECHLRGTRRILAVPASCADREQLAHLVSCLMDVGVFVFGDDFPELVRRHGDPNDNHGSGTPELGGYT